MLRPQKQFTYRNMQTLFRRLKLFIFVVPLVLLVPIGGTKQTKHNKRIKIVALGDSITKGNYNSWVEITKKETGIEFINRGINGDTLRGMDFRLVNHVINTHPDICIIMGGTNDVFEPRNDTKKMMNHLENMVMDLRFSKIKVVIGLPLPLAAYPKREVVLQSLRESIKQRFYFIDFYSDFKGREKELLADGIHPNRKGSRVMADRMKAELQKIINENI